MRGDDRLTAILTAMVLVIAIAAFLPREASLARMLGFGAGPVPRDDAFLVAQGGQHRLAVLANDLGVPAPDRAVVAVQSQPACGHARAEAGEVVLSGLEECRGRVGFDYCVAADDSCRSARVVVTIAEAAPEAARAEAEPEVARAEPGQEVVAAAVAAAVVAVPPRVADLVTVAPDSERRLAAASMFDQALPPKPPAGEDPAPARRALPALPPPARLAEAAGTAGIDERPPVSSRALVREPPALVAPAPEAPDARPEAASPSAPPASSERTARPVLPMAPVREPMPAVPEAVKPRVAQASEAPDSPGDEAAPVLPRLARSPASSTRSVPLPGTQLPPATGPKVAPPWRPHSRTPPPDRAVPDTADLAAEAPAPDIAERPSLGRRPQPLAPAEPAGPGPVVKAAAPEPMEGPMVETAAWRPGKAAPARERRLWPPQVLEGPGEAPERAVADTETAPVRAAAAPSWDPPEGALRTASDFARPAWTGPAPGGPDVPALARPERDLRPGLDTEAAAPPPEPVAPPPAEQALVTPPAAAEPETLPGPQPPAACEARLALAEMPPQTIRAELVSACRPSMPVTFGHAGLRFTVATDREGRAVAEIPAFAEEAAVEARFADGTELRGEVQVPGLERVARAALVWQGEADLKLHAFEFGAAEEAPGHVWRGAARSYREARRHGGGYLVLLGDPALDGFRSEVYTMLVGRSVPQGIVRLELEVAARGDACAAPIDFAAILTDAVRQGEQRDVRLAIDDCAGEAVSRMYRGGLRDLAIAAR